jgi:L-ascorbate metabolism protein UlaG (beta-lactamase superfamily)
MLKVTFLGHACVLLDDGEHRVIVDPFLTGNPQATTKPDEIDAKWIVVTHGHGDHVGDAVSIAKRNKATVIAQNDLASYLGKKGAEFHPMHIGGTHDFPFGKVRLTIAHHSGGGGDATEYTGPSTGTVITMGGKNVYHAGDTGIFLDMKLIGEISPLDLALLPIGDNFTMGPSDAVRAVQFLSPKLAVPIHYGTWPVIEQDPAAFVSGVESLGMSAKVLKPGESVEL